MRSQISFLFLLLLPLLILLLPGMWVTHTSPAATVSAQNVLSGEISPAPERTTAADTLSRGVVHYHITDDAGPWNIHVLEVDLTVPGVGLKAVKASNGQKEALFAMERTSSMVARYNIRTPSHDRLNDGRLNHDRLDNGRLNDGRQNNGRLNNGHDEDKSSGNNKRVRSWSAMGGVNADFYNMQNGAPINLHVSDGIPLRRPAASLSRSVFLVYEDGTPHITVPELQVRLHHKRGITRITGLNEARQENGLVLYNHYYSSSTGSNRYGTEVLIREIGSDRMSGSITFVADSVFRDRGNTTIHPGYSVLSAHGSAYTRINRHITAGDTVRVSYHYNSERPVAQAVGGMPRIVCGGQDCVDASAAREGVSEGFITTRHPRTAVGISDDGTRVYLVTVDGRQPGSVGMTLYELAELMGRLGAGEALNLDGGGSTTLVAGSQVANRPSDPTGERPVSNAILIMVDAN